MAAFNPAPPETNPPSFLGLSKPIDQPEADKSTGIGLTTLGNAIEGSVKLADSTTKQYLDSEVRKRAEATRDEYSEALTSVRNVQKTPLNLVSEAQGNAESVPTSIGTGLNNLQRLKNGFDSNKISQTEYMGRQAASMKQLRSQFPGYADYIDERASAILGVNPANAFIHSMIEDINRGADTQKSVTKETETALMEETKKGNKLAIPILQGFRAGTITADRAAAEIAEWNSMDYSLKAKAAIRAAKTGDKSDDAELAQQDFSVTSAKYVAAHWRTIKLASGTDTSQGISDYLTRQKDMDENTARQDGMILKSHRDAMYADLYKTAVSDGTLKQLGGDTEKLKTMINNSLTPIDGAIKGIYDKDSGSAYFSQNFNESLINDATRHLYGAPQQELRNFGIMSGVMNKIGGPQFTSNMFKDMMTSDVMPQYREYVGSRTLGMVSQVDADKGKIATLNSVIEEAKSKGVTNPTVYKKYTDVVKYLYDPKASDDVKMNVAKALFDPSNGAVLNHFMKDNGKIPGQISIYNKLTSEDVSKEMARLGKQDPQMWQNYRGWAENQFGNVIFRDELANIRSLSQTADTDKFQVHFDAKNSRFEITDEKDRPLTGIRSYLTGRLETSVNRLNSGLNTLKGIQAASGGDTPSYLMGVISKYAINPTGSSRYNPAATPSNEPLDLKIARKVYDAVKYSAMSFKDRYGELQDAFQESAKVRRGRTEPQ